MRCLIALCLLQAGCGGKAGLVRVRLAHPGSGFQTWSLPIPLAQSLGFYREEGLEVEIENMASAVKAMQALIGGSVDAAGIVYLQTMQLAAEGQPVRSIFVMTRRETKVLVVSPAAAGRIRRVEDLKGKAIGTPSPGSATHLWLNAILGKHGIRPEEVSAVGIGVAAPAIAAVENARVDAAALAGGDHLPLLRRHPSLLVLADASTAEGMQATYGSDVFATGVVAAKPEWLERNPDAARRLARGLRRANEWIAAHSAEEIRERLPEGFRSQDAASDLEVLRWSKSTYTPDGKMPPGAPEVVKRFVDTAVSNVREGKVDVAATWTDAYLTEGK